MLIIHGCILIAAFVVVVSVVKSYDARCCRVSLMKGMRLLSVLRDQVIQTRLYHPLPDAVPVVAESGGVVVGDKMLQLGYFTRCSDDELTTIFPATQTTPDVAQTTHGATQATPIAAQKPSQQTDQWRDSAAAVNHSGGSRWEAERSRLMADNDELRSELIRCEAALKQTTQDSDSTVAVLRTQIKVHMSSTWSSSSSSPSSSSTSSSPSSSSLSSSSSSSLSSSSPPPKWPILCRVGR